MRTFVINLKHSLERRAKMESQLLKLNIAHEFIEAVDGRNMTETERRNVTREVNYAFLPGEVGCALSHQKVYKKIINENIETALILEDDVVLCSDLCEILNNVTLSETKPEILLLSRVNKYYKKSIKKIYGSYNLHKTHQATTAHAYIINQKAAGRFLTSLYPVWMVSDKWSLFEDLSLAKIHSIVPYPVHLSEDANVSTINESKGDAVLDAKKKKIWDALMQERPLAAKLRHRYRRAISPLFNKIINQGKG
ncbi:glycosyltransferase family 25 protein [Enterobacter chuandaensis]|uniref:glycosyltransferase family 25 protein n=1 Tax=Enterobacter chuandaensis TaxID=2497875 RepID=UPI00207592F5|nr:glycosyltransferase family 25 protein [Enterobacter chuandaensis]MCM7587832.1 glycosyltransferase family 25 protein [Enterobacter chuandaensis]